MFDSATGQINPKPLQVINSENPSWLTLSKDQRHLFVVNENGPGQTDPVGRVSSFAIDPKSHELSLINQVQSLGNEPTHSSLSADSRHLFVSNYSVSEDPGGTLAVLPVTADGKLQPVVQMSSHPSSRVNAERQMSAHVHSTVSSPEGKYVFSNDLGADKVFVYRFDAKANPELPLTPGTPAFVQLPPGSGPRHLLFSADGKHAWLTMEMSAQVAVFDYRDGKLEQTQMVDLAAGQPVSDKAAAALHASADGKFLYVCNYAHGQSVAGVCRRPGNGASQGARTQGSRGRSSFVAFSLIRAASSPLISNQKSNQIVVVERDAKTGLLGKTVRQPLLMDAPLDPQSILSRDRQQAFAGGPCILLSTYADMW
ncbi:lactonase family protein [Pseudomonas sp. P8_241]|uniref:lactonase family protein n=1 Tax=Pseudomonas sp. P8_241 TaxID=3043445 RepID=UPI002A35EFE6|nr:lactonase family protein [Pseudomonas sp. P8_241]WPN44932.1 lactonase family protein [Pseudomonas sp. P8_241]